LFATHLCLNGPPVCGPQTENRARLGSNLAAGAPAASAPRRRGPAFKLFGKWPGPAIPPRPRGNGISSRLPDAAVVRPEGRRVLTGNSTRPGALDALAASRLPLRGGPVAQRWPLGRPFSLGAWLARDKGESIRVRVGWRTRIESRPTISCPRKSDEAAGASG
jgi:hypothetical protein